MYNSTFFKLSSFAFVAVAIRTNWKATPLVLLIKRAKEKGAEFIFFTRIVKLIQNKMHLTAEGLLQIINLRASINLGLSNLHKSNFPNYKPVALSY